MFGNGRTAFIKPYPYMVDDGREDENPKILIGYRCAAVRVLSRSGLRMRLLSQHPSLEQPMEQHWFSRGGVTSY